MPVGESSKTRRKPWSVTSDGLAAPQQRHDGDRRDDQRHPCDDAEARRGGHQHGGGDERSSAHYTR